MALQRSKVKREIGGVLRVDGVKMHSPATIDSDRPGSFVLAYDPGVDKFDKMEPDERESNRISRAG